VLFRSLDIRWRIKIWMPLVASLPLLMVYYAIYGLEKTNIILPVFLRSIFNDGERLLYLGPLYYMYMAALCVFSTNTINILAGINGIEGGQSLVIAVSIAIFNIQQILTSDFSTTRETHLNSLYFLLPFIGVCCGYLRHNWFPARVFGGDTFAYFAGMMFAVVSIQGHFTLTVLMFMIPQVFNFVYSCPQLFHFVECPRHRMPVFNSALNKIQASRAPVAKISRIGRLMIRFLELLSLADVNRDKDGVMIDVNNLTLINLVLTKLGPMREDLACMCVLGIQGFMCCMTFGVRWWMGSAFYSLDP